MNFLLKAKSIFISILLFTYHCVVGQDSLSLSDVIISAQRMRLGIIDPSSNINQLAGVNDLVNNVAMQGGGVNRANGTALSTISIRGGSTSQIVVLWNNLPMQSPMLGLLDYNLLPANSYDVSLLAGDAAMWGSGAVSGVIALSSKTSIKKGWHGSMEMAKGSYGVRQYVPKVSFVNQNISFSHTTDMQAQKNNYPYALGNGNFDTLTNAAVDIKNFQTELVYKLSNKAQLSLHHWYQTALRQLSPTAGSTSFGTQGDTANRVKINVDFTHRKWLFNLGVGHFDESNVYENQLAWSYGNNQFKSWITDASVNYSSSKIKFLLGSNIMSTHATSLNYRDGKEDSRWSVFYSFLYNHDGWQVNHKLRFENEITAGLPLLPSLTIAKELEEWRFQMSVNKVFRQPTLNDRYWSPGGNTALLPESGWAKELNVTYEHQVSQEQFFSFKVNAYSRKINNWIQWGREEPNPYFTALNLTEVVSKGLELIVKGKYNIGKLLLHPSLRYDYTLSTNQKAVSNPSFAVGEQLWYIPKHQAYVNCNLNYRSVGVWLNYRYASSMNGINTDLPAYDIYNAGLDYNITIANNYKITLGLGFFNIANEDYELTERRPMKRRNANMFLKIQI